MGLDMYLNKKTYVKKWNHTPDDKQFDVTVNRGGQPYAGIKPERVSYVIEEVAYWRKVNAIHQWFVDNCQDGVDDCREAYVSKDDLTKLVEVIRDIFDAAEGEERDSRAASLLPPTAGFFFGGTELDEYYYGDLQSTLTELTALLAEEDSDGDYYYQSSW